MKISHYTVFSYLCKKSSLHEQTQELPMSDEATKEHQMITFVLPDCLLCFNQLLSTQLEALLQLQCSCQKLFSFCCKMSVFLTQESILQAALKSSYLMFKVQCIFSNYISQISILIEKFSHRGESPTLSYISEQL